MARAAETHSSGETTLVTRPMRCASSAPMTSPRNRSSLARASPTTRGKYYPAMSLVKVAGLLEPGALVEIEGVAILPS